MTVLTGSTFAEMIRNGCKSIKLQYQAINDLNVFPVPDGDTGTNITSTISGGVKAIEKADESLLSDVAKKLANGMLLSARGNSGVIVSQFFSGLADGIGDLTEATLEQFSKALLAATKKAYKAVVNPVEGTVLTVAKDGTNYVAKNLSSFEGYEDLFAGMLEEMKRSLANTPNLLAVLKEAGVVDSGAAGLIAIIDGMHKTLTGEEIADTDFNGPSNSVSVDGDIPFDADSELEYGYCTEFILQLLNSKNGVEKFVLQDLIDYLSTIGDSIVAIQQETIVKIHVHTKVPGQAIAYAQQFGEFVTFKMENMSIQHNEVLLKEVTGETEEPKEKIAVVAVAPSKEISDLFLSMGAKKTIIGGQTMNPSAEDFITAFKEANAETIIVFPNNSNVILTAEQAAKLYEGSTIHVVPSKSPLQAYSSLGMVDFINQSVEDNLEIIEDQINNVVAGSVSVAVRDSVNNGIEIKEGDFISILGHEVVAARGTLLDATIALFDAVEDMDDRSVITVFYGADATEDDKAALGDYVGEKYSLMDFMEFEGNQPVYPFVLAIE